MKNASVCLVGIVLWSFVPICLSGLTGDISGVITDSTGDPLIGIEITVSNPDLHRTRVDVSGATGKYRIVALPPGRYTMTISVKGEKVMEYQNIHVSMNQVTKINPVIDDEMYITPQIIISDEIKTDKASSLNHTILTRDFLERLPNSDKLITAFSIPGSIKSDGGYNVMGGSLVDNVYIFDGVDTTDPMNSTNASNMNIDTIEEIEIQTGGFKAEYGRSMGGIVNVASRVGSSEYHGTLRLGFVDEAWHADYDIASAQEEYNYWNHAVTLDGPILKDKLWFLVSFSRYTIDKLGYAYRSYNSGYNGYDGWETISQDENYRLPYAKLIYQYNSKHKFVASINLDEQILENQSGPIYGTSETYNDLETGGPFYSLTWTWLYNRVLSFKTQLGMSSSYSNSIPHSGDMDSPPFYDVYTGMQYNNSASWTEEDRDRLQISFTANYFLDDLAGSQELKTGIAWHNTERDEYHIIPGGASYYFDNYADDPGSWMYASRVKQLFPGHSTTSAEYYGMFFQDDWHVLDNLTLNLGVRYETVTYKNADGNSSVPAWTWGEFSADSYLDDDGNFKNYADMKLEGMAAPRFGVNWDISGSGERVVSIFWGRYYNPFDLSLPGMFQPFSADPYAGKWQEYLGPEWHDADHDGIPDEDYFYDDANWHTFHEDTAGDWNLIDPNLDAEYTDEFIVGYEHELVDNIILGLTYTHRETNDIIEDVGIYVDEDGNIVWTYLGGVNDDFSGIDPNKQFDPRPGKDYSNHLYYITNVPDAKRRYNGVEVNIKGRLERYEFKASYTFSEAKGTVIDAQEGFGGVDQFSNQYDTWAFSQNLFGKLPWSCRHYIKIAGSSHWDLTDWNEISFGINMINITILFINPNNRISLF